MSRDKRRQMVLRFQSQPPEEQVPPERLLRCRALISQLMIQVMTEEPQSQEAIDEREDSRHSS